ncbi:MAG: N-acetyl sugar amidotransferase [Bacteroidota bacterium]
MPTSNRKNLILFTSSFPCGSDEVFLENEYPYLLDKFDRIVIFTSSKEKVRAQFQHKKTEVRHISKSLSRNEKTFGAIKGFFSKIYRDEVRFIRKGLKFKVNRGVNKTLLSACVLQNRIANQIEHFIHAQNFTKSETTLYSYWFDEFAYSAALIKKRNPDLMVVTRAHGWDVYFERHPNNYLPLRKFTLTNLDQCLVVSNFGAQYLKNKFKGFDAKISTSRLGTPSIVTQSEGEINSIFQLVSCSSAIQLKRIDRIIHALQLIKNAKIHWIHFGSGPLLDKLKEEASKRLGNSPNISWEFKGYVSNENVIEYYKNNQVDLFINSSETEGIPVSIMEALSCSIPCIAPNVGGISEIVNKEVGHLLSSTPNEMEIGIAIENFINQDVETRKQIELNAKVMHEKYYHSESNFKQFTAAILSQSFLQPYHQCARCLYDNHVYPNITFDSKGNCNICYIYEDLQERTVMKGAVGAQKLSNLINEIKSQGADKEFDCILGVSGGVDSSYVAYLSKEWGLRPYVIHVDGGWNSDISVKNIASLLKKLGLDLHTHVIDWQEMKDIQRSFIKASVLDIDLPFDNAFMAILYQIANKLGIKYILSGHNTETEGWMPETFTHYKLDTINIKSIHKKFGEQKIKSFPMIGPIQAYHYNSRKGIKMVSPLDLIDYNKAEVKEFLIKDFDWIDYGGKHYENTFTRFYQSYILYHKFNIDKRISHLSTLINSGQMTKEKAIEELQKLPYNLETIDKEKEFFAKKLGFSVQELEEYVKSPGVSHVEFGSYLNVFKKLKNLRDLVLLK